MKIGRPNEISFEPLEDGTLSVNFYDENGFCCGGIDVHADGGVYASLISGANEVFATGSGRINFDNKTEYSMSAKVETYRQILPSDWLRDHPDQTWRCDIFPDDGLGYHGTAETEAEAIQNAAKAYRLWVSGYRHGTENERVPF